MCILFQSYMNPKSVGVGYDAYVMQFFVEVQAFRKYVFWTTDFLLLTAVYDISLINCASCTLIYFNFEILTYSHLKFGVDSHTLNFIKKEFYCHHTVWNMIIDFCNIYSLIFHFHKLLRKLMFPAYTDATYYYCFVR